jgi:hypothetical protein
MSFCSSFLGLMSFPLDPEYLGKILRHANMEFTMDLYVQAVTARGTELGGEDNFFQAFVGQ